MAPVKRANAHLPPAHQQEEQVLCCPLCISELDAAELVWEPCRNCGYQLCLFCYDRIKTEFSNQCPGCRTPYDPEYATLSLVQPKEASAQPERPQPAAAPAAATASTAAEPSSRRQPAPAVAAATPARGGGGGGGGAAAAAAAAAVAAVPASPGRDLHIDEDQFWPTLSSAAQSARASAAPTAATSRHTSPRDTPSPPPVATRGHAPWGAVKTASSGGEGPQEQEHLEGGGGGAGGGEQHLQHEGSSSSSSAATTATTPQSPASSVVAYRARAAGDPGLAQLLQGTCSVSLAPSALAPPPLDEAGAGLALSLQEAVRAGSIGVKQAAASLVAYLRQRQAQQAAAAAAAASHGIAAGGARGGWPGIVGAPVLAAGGGLAAAAGRIATPGGGIGSLGSGGLFGSATSGGLPLEGSPSLAISEAPTFAHWGRSDGEMLSPMSSMHMPGAGLFDGWSSPGHASPAQQQQQRQVTPMSSAGRLPLYARGAASAIPSSQSAGSVTGSGGSGSAGFPGFEQHLVSSPVQLQAAPGLMSPPGFSRSTLQQHKQQQQRQRVAAVQHL